MNETPDAHSPETFASLAAGQTLDAAESLLSHSERLKRRREIGTTVVTIALSFAIAAGIGFLAVYWTIDNNMLMGTCLAIAFGGLGVALVSWGRLLMENEQVIACREPLPSSSEEREKTAETFYPGEPRIQRRKLITGMAAGVVGTLVAAWISVLRSFFGDSPYGPPLMSTIWKRGQGLITEEGKMITVDTLQPGSAVVVYPEKHLGYVSAQSVLIRVHPEYLELPPERAAWAPMGYIAYSRVCTHAGCPVGLFERTNDILLCPCHQSTFNVLDGAQPTGGPAARPLPQLPLFVDAQGYLRAAGDFTEPPGPGFWSIP